MGCSVGYFRAEAENIIAFTMTSQSQDLSEQSASSAFSKYSTLFGSSRLRSIKFSISAAVTKWSAEREATIVARTMVAVVSLVSRRRRTIDDLPLLSLTSLAWETTWIISAVTSPSTSASASRMPLARNSSLALPALLTGIKFNVTRTDTVS